MAMKIVKNTAFEPYSVQYSVHCTVQCTVYSTLDAIFLVHHRHVGCFSTHWVVFSHPVKTKLALVFPKYALAKVQFP